HDTRTVLLLRRHGPAAIEADRGVRNSAADPPGATKPPRLQGGRQRAPRRDRPPQERRAHRSAGGCAGLHAPHRARSAQGVPPGAVRSARQVEAMSDEKRKPDSSPPRKDERVTINKEFESYEAFITEYVTNISRSGVFVRSKSPLAIGTQVNLRFTVIMD